MKKVIAVFVFLAFTLYSQAQDLLDPIKWTMTQEQINETEYDLIFTATAQKTWVVYSQHTEGATPTIITYEIQKDIQFIGESKEYGHKKEGPDKFFDGDNIIKYLSDEPFIIKQRIKITGPNPKAIGYLEYMTCDNTKCIGGLEAEFDFKLSPLKSNGKKASAPSSTTQFTLNTSAVETNTASNQDLLDPIKWTMSQNKLTDNTYELIFTANAENPWVVYSQYTEDNGPTPTLITYEEKSDIEFIGKSLEFGHKKEGPDKLFDNVNVIKYLSDQAYIIKQIVKITGPNPKAKGYLEYMTCDKTKCIGGLEAEFDFNLSDKIATVPTVTDVQALAGEFKLLDQKRDPIISSLANPVGDCGEEEDFQNKGLLWTFILGFIGGLLALLTPCVFPMIPLTVSFFTKDTKRKGWMNGLLYGASIIVIYVALGLVITSFFGAEALNRLSTSWIANTLFFIVFLFFAFSFFGYYEITLPSSWSSKSDRMADKGGLIGIFFMAFTLAIVSFSCTGPIIGSALVQSATNKIGPLVVMLGFSSALALPFGLFAAFPSWLNSLPKSGGWMNSVKVVLGFLEVALAFKFLSVADMTNHWGFLRYELFMGIWVLVFAATAAYLFGWIKFPHDSPGKQKLSPVRWGFALLTTVWTLYLITGFFYNDDSKSYNSLKLMSGLAPPARYNFLLDEAKGDDIEKKTYSSYSKCANNIDCFKDYEEGLAYAQKHNKPLLIDMTGHGCVNCRKTEEHIWVDPNVKSKLNDDFVLISLYVDDDKKLDQTYISANRKGKKIRNVGNKWADFQIVNFMKNAQPLYIIVSPDEKVLAAPRGFKDGVEGYNDFLDCGMEAFKKKG